MEEQQIIWLSNLSILSVTWWRLFQKYVVCTKFNIYVFITSLGTSKVEKVEIK
jgi:hypothetical protein